MKEHRFMADPMKFWAAFGTCVFLLLMAWRAAVQGYIFAAVILSIIVIVFAFIAVLYGSVLYISSRGIERKFLFVTMGALTWEQVREVGVVGTGIFFTGDRNKKRTGRRYIYISPRELDEDTRFKMALEWPPRNGVLYCTYSHPRIDAIQYLWGKPIEKYNAGDIFVDFIE